MNMQLPYGFMPQIPNMFNNSITPIEEKFNELEKKIIELEKRIKKLEEQNNYTPYHNNSMQML